MSLALVSLENEVLSGGGGAKYRARKAQAINEAESAHALVCR